MIVRVFKTKGTYEDTAHGTEFEFDVLPEKGQVLQFSAEDRKYDIEKVEFIQDGNTFKAAIWIKQRPVSILDLVEKSKPE